MSRFIVLACLLCLSAASNAAATIVVFGDSLSAGYGLRAGQAWPNLLAQRLHARDPGYVVVNASISGETTAGGRTRLPVVLRQHEPKAVIIALGANDGLRGLPIEAMRDNLHAMIAAARDARAKVLLVGMELPPNYGQHYASQFRAVFADLAKSLHVPLVPFLLAGFAEKQDLFQADMLHPTAAAQPLILDNVWPGLAPLLKQ